MNSIGNRGGGGPEGLEGNRPATHAKLLIRTERIKLNGRLTRERIR